MAAPRGGHPGRVLEALESEAPGWPDQVRPWSEEDNEGFQAKGADLYRTWRRLAGGAVERGGDS